LNLPPLQWIKPVPVEVSGEVISAAGGSLPLAESLARRGIKTAEEARAFLNHRAYLPSPPQEIPDLMLAADRLEEAIHRKEKIGVWGDFDVDGQTSTTLLVSGLRRLGAEVTFHIPVREKESHGITIPALKEFLKQEMRILLTCDTGISAHDAVRFANSVGVDVVITDHHTLPPELPPALAVVNPQRLTDKTHPLAGLCGVGCAFQLMKELFRRFGLGDELDAYLDLVALGTVADVAILTGDNRYLVQAGLERLQNSPRPAIQAILEFSGIRTGNLNEEHIGFILAPRLNALGRLDDTNPIVDFLTSNSPEVIRPMASRLEALNARRKQYCDQVFRAAQEQIKQEPSLLEYSVLVLNHPTWPAGVIGIVASKLAELYHRPSILISNPQGDVGRGSARSIGKVDITASLSAVQQLLNGFGGHKMAAGFSIKPEKISEFRRELSKYIKNAFPEDSLGETLTIDFNMDFKEISPVLVESLNRLGPFGPGNPPITLAAYNVTIKNKSLIGKSREHLQLIVQDETENTARVIWWQGAGLPVPEGKFDLAYQARSSNYRGYLEVQFEWITARTQEDSIHVNRETSTLATTIQDLRNIDEPIEQVKDFIHGQNVLIWAEGKLPEDIPTVNRMDLKPCRTLVIWSIPPSLTILNNAIEICAPKEIILCASENPSDAPAIFLKQLVGLTKYALKQTGGWLEIEKLAAATGQRESAIEIGLSLLEINGFIHLAASEDNKRRYQLNNISTTSNTQKEQIENKLIHILKETAAFRGYFKSAEAAVLINLSE
jgi:single-stranded-DNA-specific exonuclease